MPTYEDFSNWLKQEIDKRGWDQAELARRARLNPALISRLVTRERRPSPATSVAIARALGLPPEEVFRQAGLLPRQKGPTEKSEELLHYFTSLSEDDQKRIILITRTLAEQSGE